MAKTKNLMYICDLCKEKITLTVSFDVIKNRAYFPFPYIDIHGNPEHATTLYLDHDLSVRHNEGTWDLNLAIKKKETSLGIVYLSEEEALAGIYSDPLRLKIFSILSNGPITEKELLNVLKEEEKGFHEEDLVLLMSPFFRAGLISTSWFEKATTQCYFLTQDFVALKIPPQKSNKEILSDMNLAKAADVFFTKQKAFFKKNRALLMDSSSRLKETQKCLNILGTPKFKNIIEVLRDGPKNLNQLIGQVDIESIKELINLRIIGEIIMGNRKYYALLYDVGIIKFTPKYLLNILIRKLKNKEISKEIAITHLKLLHDNEININLF